MKIRNLAIIAAMTSIISTSALAAAGDYYGRLDAGYSLSRGKLSGQVAQNIKANSYAGNVGVGYYFANDIRMDVNFGWTGEASTRVKTGALSGAKFRMKSYSGMVNGYYDFNDAEIIPYVTVGLGAIHAKGKVIGSPSNGAVISKVKNKTAFAYQAGIGVGYEISPKVLVDLGYRFTGNTLKKSKNAAAVSVKPDYANAVLVGARISF